jgi:hypothetical protein
VTLASIVIVNYNYGRFLEDAIRSALAQTHAPLEVIVVDDGSTDDSRAVIGRYEDWVKAVLKANGGHASAYNAGFAASAGDAVLFLDSDDMLLPAAIECAMPFFDDPLVAKVHWPMWMADEHGRSTGHVWPPGPLPEGDLRCRVCRMGPSQLAPASMGVYARWFVQALSPIPEDVYRMGSDGLLFEAAPFFGRLGWVREPQFLYRQHGANDHVVAGLGAKLQRGLQFFDHYAPILVDRCRQAGFEASRDEWVQNAWWHRLARAIEDLARLPPGPLVLVDDGALEGGAIVGRAATPLLTRDGVDWGPPADDDQAIAALEERRRAGSRFLAFLWPAFWWLDHYQGFRRHLESVCRLALRNDVLVVFDLA